MSLKQRVLRIEGALSPEPELVEGLCALTRYLIVHFQLPPCVSFGKAREEMTPDEWDEFRRGALRFFDSHQSEFGTEKKMREYISFHAKLGGEELRQAVAELRAEPDAGDYFY